MTEARADTAKAAKAAMAPPWLYPAADAAAPLGRLDRLRVRLRLRARLWWTRWTFRHRWLQPLRLRLARARLHARLLLVRLRLRWRS